MKWVVISALVTVCLSFYFVRRNHNNVCKTFWDYYSDRDNNPNCYHNPDTELTVPEIIQRRGYPVKEYRTTTKDGYILTLFRIPQNESSKNTNQKQPILIQHGFGMSSAGFVNLGKKSLAFILADAGYDVWLGNFRGTVYSRNHTQLSDKDSKFWDFTMDELGAYDLPATIDLVHDVTKQKIIYIGFSMGTITAYMYGTTYPEAAYEKIKIFISLAPSAFLKEGTFLFKRFFWMWPYVEPFLHWLSKGEITPRGTPNSLIRKILCLPLPVQMYICQVPEMVTWGFDYEQNDPETLPITLIHNSDSCSFGAANQIVQFSATGDFEKFDYGVKRNMEKYGSAEPPKYDLSKLKVPTYLIRGENDLIVTKEDVEKLNRSLPNEAKPYDIYVIKYDKFNHGDFVVAKDVVPFLYDHIVKFINKL